ncbi:F-box-like protein [Rhizoctonia solani]|uniref:F-box-like protein n=1 Tax=Rhizoctonia solani TaxID=456999 RepID=A0A8H8P9Z8_9AGAM|nr:F-box-like protein [Rhizoctonia solani]QRW26511.1 F-box-like protein [Rhizoctonia solani]
MTTPNQSESAVKTWEEASALLLSAFDAYALASADLGAESSISGANPSEFSPKIDSILETVDTAILNQLPKISTNLKKQRNKLVSPTSHLPEEILSEIFRIFVFDPSLDATIPLDMEASVRLIYSRLGTLCTVSSTWRDILNARGRFWSVIPMIEVRSTDPITRLEPYERSFHNARDAPLHLAATIDHHTYKDTLKAISEHGLRLRTANFMINYINLKLARGFIKKLMRYNIGVFSELSIMHYYVPYVAPCDNSDYDGYNDYNNYEPEPGLPTEDDFIFPHDSPEHTSFAQFLGSLTAFRISNVLFHWDNIAFSSRLVELRMQEVNLGYDDAIILFLKALSSASQLRDLKIIAVDTFHKPSITTRVDTHSITFPNLQRLLVKELYFNTFQIIVSMISPLHPLVLSFNYKITRINKLDDDDVININPNFLEDAEADIQNADMNIANNNNGPTDPMELWDALGPIQVETLRLPGTFTNDLPPQIRKAMRAMPGLLTLEVENVDFTASPDEHGRHCHSDALNRSNKFESDPEDPEGKPFPALEKLRLTRVIVDDSTAFREMVTSHPLRELVIGGRIRLSDSHGTNSLQPIHEDSDLVRWLRGVVPDVRVVDSDYRLPGFYDDVWQLW